MHCPDPAVVDSYLNRGARKRREPARPDRVSACLVRRESSSSPGQYATAITADLQPNRFRLPRLDRLTIAQHMGPPPVESAVGEDKPRHALARARRPSILPWLPPVR